VLDIGCGTGEHVLLAASLGLDVTGIDASPTAIGLAKRKAEARNIAARFLVWDAFALADLHEQFDTVLDCGLLHTFDAEDRTRLVDSVGAVVAPGGTYCVLAFSNLQPGDWGPRRLTENDIRASFSNGWHMESLERATIDVNINDGQVQAWLAVLTRT
jgi:2-polyprenyl-3-methyl-5-hydroxy-6-metoxy-1,4-benzoquinol methylase